MRAILISSIVLLNIGCDQISKNIVRNKIKDNEIINVVKDNIVLKIVENPGAILGLGGNLPNALKTFYFQILPIIFLLFLLRMIIIETEFSKLTVIGIAFAIGGGVGNIYDRIFYGSVTDFIIVEIGLFKTGVFNTADISIIIGIILAFLGIIIDAKKSQKASL